MEARFNSESVCITGFGRACPTRLFFTLGVLLLLANSSSALAETVLYFPASAHAEGKNGTFFVTDARVFNPSSSTLSISLSFLPPGSDNRNAQEVTLPVSARRAVALDDVVSRTLGTGGGGAIRMRSSGAFQAVSRTYNNATPAAGTFGLSIPAVGKEAALTQGVLPFLSNQPGTPGFRSNVGFVNPGDTTANVTLKLLNDSTGAVLGQTTLDLFPQGFHQINDVFALLGLAGPTSNATLTFTASAPVLAYATVLDNISGDAIFLQAQPDFGSTLSTSQFIRASANAAGKNGTYFVTDLRLFNPGSTNVVVNMSFLQPNTDNRGAVESSFGITPRHTLTFKDIVNSTLHTSGGGGIRIRGSGNFLAASRTFNNATPAAGTFGLSIPGTGLSAATERGLLLFMANQPGLPGYRSNVGFVNPGNSTLTVTYVLIDAGTGFVLGQSSLDLPPYGYQQLNDVFTLLGNANKVTTNAMIQFGANAPVLAYATVLDNISGDAIYIAGQRDVGLPHTLSPSWSKEIQISQTSGSAQGSIGRKMAVDSQGWMHVVWTEQQSSISDLYYSRSIDGGKTWSQAIDIANSPQAATGGNIAIGPDNTIHVAWDDARDGGASRLYYTRSRDRGSSWEASRDLSGPSALGAAAPSISVDTANRVHISWHIGNPDSTSAIAEVHYIRSTNAGGNFDVGRRLSSVTGQHAAWPRFTVEGTNGQLVAVVWRDNRRNPDWDLYMAISTDRGVTFQEKAVVATGNREWDPEALVDNGGKIHLTYTTQRTTGPTIEYQRSTDQGTTWSSAVTVSEARSQLSSWVLDRLRGILWLWWKDERDADPAPANNARSDVAARYSLDGGISWGPLEFATNEGDLDVQFPSIAAGLDGRLYVNWSDTRNGSSKQSLFFRARESQVP